MTINHYHDDKEFEDAICEYQDGNTTPLENWLAKTEVIDDDKKIDEIIGQIFMIYDSYFVSGTSALLAKAIEKIKPNPNVNYNKEKLLDPSLWTEEPQDFAKLFLTYEKIFCLNKKEANKYRHKTVSEHFHQMKDLDKQGFWDAVMWFDFDSKGNERNNHNMLNIRPNIELWLSRVNNVKNWVQPYYCLPIEDEVKFTHLAYAVYHHGIEIQRKILGQYPKDEKDVSMTFAQAAKELEYDELSIELNNNINKNTKKPKL
jgi:hypothetical protein